MEKQMPKSVSLAFKTTEETDKRLAQLARETRRPKEWHLEQALHDYLEHEEWLIEEIKEGLADLHAGRVIPHEKVMEWVASWGTTNELPPPVPSDDDRK
jgi:predicted transcriptional regulator